MNKSFIRKNNIQLIFLSDSLPSPTNFVYKIAKFLKENNKDYETKFVRFTFINAIKLYIKVCKSIWNKDCLIIQSHHTKSLLLNINLKLISKFFFYGEIYSFHTLHYELKRFYGLKLFIFKLSKNFIDQYSCVSSALAIQWVKLFDKKIDIIQAGISNEEKEEIKRKSLSKNLEKDKKEFFTISWVGRFEEVKRPEYFLKAVNKLVSIQNKKLRIYIAGDGSLRGNIIKNIASINKVIDTTESIINVEYLGLLNRNRLFNLIAKTDLYVNTSSSESLCLTVIEFLSNPACNLILPDIQVLREYYECGRVKYFNKDSIEELVQLISDSINHNKNIDFNADNNLPSIYKKLNLENASEYYINLYSGVIKK